MRTLSPSRDWPRARSCSHLQEAFLDCGGAQCGICTPGMILAASHLLKKKPEPTLEEIREGLSGNLCRCTGYIQIFEAVAEAARRQDLQVRNMRSDPADYQLVAPGSLQAVVSLLAEEPGAWLPIAGGTDVMVQYAAGKLPARKLVSIWNLPELRRIEVLPDEIQIGAGCTYTDLREHAVRAARIFAAGERRQLDGRNRQPESGNARRQHRECLSGGGFAAGTAGV